VECEGSAGEDLAKIATTTLDRHGSQPPFSRLWSGSQLLKRPLKTASHTITNATPSATPRFLAGSYDWQTIADDEIAGERNDNSQFTYQDDTDRREIAGFSIRRSHHVSLWLCTSHVFFRFSSCLA